MIFTNQNGCGLIVQCGLWSRCHVLHEAAIIWRATGEAIQAKYDIGDEGTYYGAVCNGQKQFGLEHLTKTSLKAPFPVYAGDTIVESS